MNIWTLAHIEARRSPWSLIALAALSLCGAMLVTATIIANHWLHFAADHMGISEEAGLSIIVHPPQPQTDIGISFERPLINADHIAELEAIDGVRNIRTVLQIPTPTMIGMRFPGFFDMVQTIVMYEMGPDSIAPELRERWHDDPTGKQVPIIINSEALTMFNLGIADRYGLPRVEFHALSTQRFDLFIGEDEITRIGPPIHDEVVAIGTSPDFPPWGIAVSPETSKRYRDHFQGKLDKGYGFVSATIVCANTSVLENVEARIAELGLRIDNRPQLAKIIAQVVTWAEAITLAIVSLTSLSVIAAVLIIMSMLAAERRRQYALWLTVGAKLPQLIVMSAAGMAAYAGISAACGALLTWGASSYAANWLSNEAAGTLEIPSTYNAPWWPLLSAPLGAVVLVVLAATPSSCAHASAGSLI